MNSAFTLSPSLDDMQAVADDTLAHLPAELVAHVDGVVVRVVDFPEAEIMAEMELESPFDLLGLYLGTAQPDKSVADVAQHVDMVFLYRRAILDYWCEVGEDLNHIIRHVLIHEIGHHFGFSDTDMDRIENQPAGAVATTEKG